MMRTEASPLTGRRLCLAAALAAGIVANAQATVTITSAERFVSVFPTGGVETKSQSSAAGGGFVGAVDAIGLPDEGSNDGSLHADQDSTIAGLTVFGSGMVVLGGSNPHPPGFSGTADSSLTLQFQLSQHTLYSIAGLLNELEGGAASAQASLLDSLSTPIFDFATSASDPVLLFSDSGVLAPGAYFFKVQAFGAGSPDADFFDLAAFNFNLELEEQQVVPEPASFAAWGLIGVTFVGAQQWRTRRRTNS